MDIENNRKSKRRNFGEHLTSVKIFSDYILPHLKDNLYNYIWVDLFAGEGNLILPILETIPYDERVEFFKERMFLFEIQKVLVQKAIEKAGYYGIPRDIAAKNIIQQDTLYQYPTNIFEYNLPVFHITNPPYLYLGYIAKHGGRNLSYFKGINEGYQDLYQIALMNDLRNNIEIMTYIIPSNYLFSDSSSNKIRKDFLNSYSIKKVYLFEDKIFDNTGTNVGIFFFNKKNYSQDENLNFTGIKIKNGNKINRLYTLKHENNYRAGNNFGEFVKNYKASRTINVKFYLTEQMIVEQKGEQTLEVINANKLNGKNYEREFIQVSNQLKSDILSNILYVRTIDTGNAKGRVGLYEIQEKYGVNGIYTTETHRTHPIQLFFYPPISYENQIYLKNYFNLLLEYFREIDDSEFLSTFKYSNADYTRKYLGLTQTKQLIRTFPILDLSSEQENELKKLIDKKQPENIIEYMGGRGN